MLNENCYIFDTHAHYDSHKFSDDRDAVLSAMPDGGVGRIINCGCDIESTRFSVALAEKYDFVYAAVGIHPHDCDQWNDDFAAELETLLAHPKVVAVGEVGLDYHYDFNPRELQQQVFEAHIQIAKRTGYPIIIHDREAHGDMYRILRKYAPLCGVMHCFSGSVELMREAVDIGLHIGLGGSVTFKNAVHPIEVAKAVPDERLLLETDAPYMTPVPHRGKRCDSRHIEFTAHTIADARGIDYHELLKLTAENASRLFGIAL